MQDHPFALFAPFANALHVELYDKADDLTMTKDLARVLGKNFATPKQVHGSRAIVACGAQMFGEEADAIATNIPGLTLALCCADCQIWTIYAPGKNVIGLAHAGWRGLMRGVLPSLYRLLQKEWGIEPRSEEHTSELQSQR